MSIPPANYYNDGRDVLENAYPTSTSFTRYHLRPTLAGFKRRKCGVSMVISLESDSALERFRQVCYGIECAVPWDRFHFDVYDFSGIADLLPVLSPFGTVVGAGEIYWIRGGCVVNAMTSDYDPPRFDEFTEQILVK
jgi:hypothetical protein